MAIEGPRFPEGVHEIVEKHFQNYSKDHRITPLISAFGAEISLDRLLKFAVAKLHSRLLLDLLNLQPHILSKGSVLRELLDYYPDVINSSPAPSFEIELASVDKSDCSQTFKNAVLALLEFKCRHDGIGTEFNSQDPVLQRFRALIYASMSMDIILYQALITITHPNITAKAHKFVTDSDYPVNFKLVASRPPFKKNDLMIWVAAYLASENEFGYLEELSANSEWLSEVDLSAVSKVEGLHKEESALQLIAEAACNSNKDVLLPIFTHNSLIGINFNAVFQGTQISLFACIISAASRHPGGWEKLLNKMQENFSQFREALKGINYQAKIPGEDVTVETYLQQNGEINRAFQTIRMLVNTEASLIERRASMPRMHAALVRTGSTFFISSKQLHVHCDNILEGSDPLIAAAEFAQALRRPTFQMDQLALDNAKDGLSVLTRIIEAANCGYVEPLKAVLERIGDERLKKIKAKGEGIEAGLSQLESNNLPLFNQFNDKISGVFHNRPYIPQHEGSQVVPTVELQSQSISIFSRLRKKSGSSSTAE